MAIPTTSRDYVKRAPVGGLDDAVEAIVDKGMIIDGFARVTPSASSFSP
jgi:hypothetical protein